MTKTQRKNPSFVALPPEEKKIVEEFVNVFNKHKRLGVIRLVDACRIAFESEMEYRRNRERKKYVH